MRADPSAQLTLLELQALDSRLDAIRRQAANLPESAQLQEQAGVLRALRDRETDLRTEAGDLTREQRKADDDVEQVRSRRTRDQQRLDSGAATNPKDLERLQHELVSLARRISDLEDVELEVMERLEAAQTDLDATLTQAAELQASTAELTAARDAKTEALRAEHRQVGVDRTAAAQRVPGDLLGLYDRLREQKGGVGAAVLRARRCEGCSLQLDNAELAVIAAKPADEVVRCEECGRILVRTAESGL